MPVFVRWCERTSATAGPTLPLSGRISLPPGRSRIGLRSALSSRGAPVPEETEMVTRRPAEQCPDRFTLEDNVGETDEF